MTRCRNVLVLVAVIVCLHVTWSLDAGDSDERRWGDITGRIVWGKKEVPKQSPINLGDNPDAKDCQKEGPILDETCIVNPKNRGVKDAFVWLEPADASKMLAIHPDEVRTKPKRIILDTPGCKFVPHAMALREGDALVLKNTSPLAQHVKFTCNPKGPNFVAGFLFPPQNFENVVDDLKADSSPIRIDSNIHPWMYAWMRVFDHPYFALTDSDGKFSIKSAPAGRHRIKIWHPSIGWLDGAKGKNGQPIEIRSGDNMLNDFQYPQAEWQSSLRFGGVPWFHDVSANPFFGQTRLRSPQSLSSNSALLPRTRRFGATFMAE